MFDDATHKFHHTSIRFKSSKQRYNLRVGVPGHEVNTNPSPRSREDLVLAIDLRQIFRLLIVGGFGLRQSKVREGSVNRSSKPVVDFIEAIDDVLNDNVFRAV